MGRAFAPNIITSDKAAGGATIERSISLNDGSVVRFHRTGSVGVDGNRRVHTVSMWMKRTVIGSERHFFSARNASSTPYNDFRFEASDKLNCYYYSGTWNSTSWRYYNSHQKYRDSNGWYHFVFAFNSTLSTASERVKIYMNGERVTSFDTAEHPQQNHENSICGNGYTHAIAGLGNVASQNWDGNLAECILVDGAELEPTDFAFTDGLTGHWKPKKFDPVKSNIPNKKGIVYSSTWTASGNGFGSAPVTRAYDAPTGNLNSNYANNNAGGQILTWDTSSFNLKGSLRIYGYSSSGVYDVYVNGQKAADTPSSHGWFDCGTHAKINEIQFAGTSYNTNNGLGSAGIYFAAFIVDGVWLRDDTHPFGQEGHHINFSDTSGLTATTIGRDHSGSGNNFTPVNLQSDMINIKDSCSGFAYPTTSPVPANYPIWNRVQNQIDAATELGCRRISGANYRMARASFIFGPSNGITSGRYYWEINNSGGGSYSMYSGITASFTQSGGEVANEANKNILGSHYHKTFSATSGTSRTNEGVGACSFQIDLDARVMRAYYKGSLVFTDTSIPDATTTDFAPYTHSTNGSWMDVTINFGQVAFNYPALAAGYRILASNAVPSTSIKPEKHFDTLLYTGDGSSNNRVTGLGFKPDLIWIKSRSTNDHHIIQDTVRGNFILYPNLSSTDGATGGGWVKSFNDDGFTTDVNGPINTNGHNYAAWCWKAGGTASSNTDGDITSSVSVNQEAGFSIVTWTGDGNVNSTVGHGLNGRPDFIMLKSRTQGYNWRIYHNYYGTTATSGLFHATNGSIAHDNYGGIKAITTTTFGFGTNGTNDLNGVNRSGDTYVAYCWKAVEGYSSFGSYLGNGQTDNGPFVNLGFRPSLIIRKKISDVGDWLMMDTTRHPDNVVDNRLLWTSSQELGSGNNIDILSNGFKERNTDGYSNANNAIMIYMAWGDRPAHTPFGIQNVAR